MLLPHNKVSGGVQDSQIMIPSFFDRFYVMPPLTNGVHYNSSIDKTPLVITCSKDSITIKGKGVRDRQITQTSRKNLELENKLMYELNAFDQNQYYFVFLVKPSASDYFMRVLTRFLGLKKNADYGMEPISEREDL